MIKLSIIVPIYNVEKYLKRCLDSLLEQDLAQEEYEIICVNDCSPDDSLNIVNNYLNLHGNISLFSNVKNLGLGATRNVGLKLANGKYIWYVDSDDFIEKKCLNEIVSTMENNDLDVFSFNFSRNYDTLENKRLKVENNILNGKKFLNDFYKPEVFSSCSNTYKKSYLIENSFFFAEGIYWEDADLVLKMFYYANRIVKTENTFYYYCHNSDSISRTSSGKKYSDLFKLGARKFEFAKTIENENKELALSVINDAIWNASAIKKVFLLNRSERELFYKEIRNNNYSGLKNSIDNRMIRWMYQFPKFTLFLMSILNFIYFKIYRK